jgi:cell division protein FtsB
MLFYAFLPEKSQVFRPERTSTKLDRGRYIAAVNRFGVDIFSNKGYKRYLGPFLQALFQGSKRRAGVVLVVILATAYGWMFLLGPQGLQTLIEKRREIRQLEERNANIRLENERRKERIRRLQESRSEQEMEIRKQLKLQRPGETTFILPESEQKEKAVPSPQ